MSKTRAVRALIYYPYTSHQTGKTYNSVLLVRNPYNHDKLGLPGGQVKEEEKESDEQALRREIMEELGLEIASLKFIMQVNGSVSDHQIYKVEASSSHKDDNDKEKGYLVVNNDGKREINGIGFYNAGRHNQLRDARDTGVIEGHFGQLLERGFRQQIPREWNSGDPLPFKIHSRDMQGWYGYAEGARTNEARRLFDSYREGAQDGMRK